MAFGKFLGLLMKKAEGILSQKDSFLLYERAVEGDGIAPTLLRDMAEEVFASIGGALISRGDQRLAGVITADVFDGTLTIPIFLMDKMSRVNHVIVPAADGGFIGFVPRGAEVDEFMAACAVMAHQALVLKGMAPVTRTLAAVAMSFGWTWSYLMAQRDLLKFRTDGMPSDIETMITADRLLSEESMRRAGLGSLMKALIAIQQVQQKFIPASAWTNHDAEFSYEHCVWVGEKREVLASKEVYDLLAALGV